KNGSAVAIMSHSERSVRGVHPQKIRCDEVELITPEVFDAAQLATQSRLCGDTYVRGSVECFSTMHQPWGVIQRLIDECRHGRRILFKWNIADALARCGLEHTCHRLPVPPEVGAPDPSSPHPIITSSPALTSPPPHLHTSPCPLWP